MRSLKQRSNRHINIRKQQAGDGNHNIQSVGMPIQYFNPSAKVPAYYPSGHEMLTKQYVSGLGPVNAVNTTQPNACGTEMGPSLSAFSPYEDVSMMTGGGSVYRQIVNPLTNRKVSVSSKLGQQIINQYINVLSAGGPKTKEEIAAEHKSEDKPLYVGRPRWDGKPMEHDPTWPYADDDELSMDHPHYFRQPYFKGHPYSTLDAKTLGRIQGSL